MTKKRLSREHSELIITELGGVNETARKLNTYSSCVSVWKRRGFPVSYVYQLKCKFPNLKSLRQLGQTPTDPPESSQLPLNSKR